MSITASTRAQQPSTAQLDEHLLKLQEEWLALPREQQDQFYADTFGPAFVPLFRQLPIDGAPAEMPQPRALVSLLGLSWQPIALMAARVQPERMLVLGTENSFVAPAGTEQPLERIARVSGMALSMIEWQRVEQHGEEDIYVHVRRFIDKHHLDPREVAVDPTGGKKWMCVAAALAAFLRGAPIVYVDCTQYRNRLPVAGTEYPRLISNPLEIFGELDVERIKAAFNRGDFEEAVRRSEELASKVNNPRQANCLGLLARAYAEWAQFRFVEAKVVLESYKLEAQKFAAHNKWDWALNIAERVKRHVELLGCLASVPKKPASMDECIHLVVNHIAMSRRMQKEGRVSLAALLLYSALESYFDLQLYTNYQLDDEHPDWERFSKEIDLDEFDRIGRVFHGKLYRKGGLQGPIGFGLAAQILATMRPELMQEAELHGLLSLMNARNRCEFTHGRVTKPITSSDLDRFLPQVETIVGRHFGTPPDGFNRLRQDVLEYQFPQLI